MSRSFSHWPSRKSKWRDEALEEAGSVLLVVAEGAQQHEDAQAALAGDAGAGGDVLAGLLLDVELDPLAAVGVDGALDELVLGQVAQAEPLARLEDDARGCGRAATRRRARCR